MSEERQTYILNGFRERVTGGAANINTDHKYIHEGIAYKAHLQVGSLAASNGMAFSFLAPANKYVHFKNFKLFGVGATLRMRLIRGTTANPLTIDNPDSGAIGAGDLIGPHNVNDVSANVTGVEIGKTPTYTGGASGEVWDQVILSGSSTNKF